MSPAIVLVAGAVAVVTLAQRLGRAAVEHQQRPAVPGPLSHPQRRDGDVPVRAGGAGAGRGEILSSAQVWTIAGTGPDSVEGTIVNLHTKAYLGVANGTVGTFSTARPAGAGWRFTVVDGGAILSYVGAPQPNVLTIEPDGRAVLDVPRAGDPRQLLAFTPAETEHLS